MNDNTFLKPGQYAENRLLGMILDGTWQPGAQLPGERVLARQIGVTRPTLRETLKRLNGEGWVRIRHGKPTVVNNYMRDGGLGLLASMTRHGDYLPVDFIGHFLEIRALLLPAAAGKAARRDPERLEACLRAGENLDDTAEAFRRFDWKLQVEMATLSANPVFRLILNDFAPVFRSTARTYFGTAENRIRSGEYYRKLLCTIVLEPDDVESVVREAMLSSIAAWKRVSGGLK